MMHAVHMHTVLDYMKCCDHAKDLIYAISCSNDVLTNSVLCIVSQYIAEAIGWGRFNYGQYFSYFA